MHIALFIPDLNGGGAQHMVINMANEMAKHGHQVDLVIAQTQGEYIGRITPDVHIIDLKSSRVLQSFLPLVGYLKSARPDIFLSAMTYVNIVSLMTKIWVRNLPTKFIVTERNHLPSIVNHAKSGSHMLYRVLVPFFYKRADAVVGISKGVAEDIGRVGGVSADRLHWIHNPVVTQQTLEFVEETSDFDLSSLRRDPEEILLISSGRLVQQKDYKTMFCALKLIKKKRAVRLVVLGKGVLEQELREFSKEIGVDDYIEFMGFVSNPLSIMKQADMFLISSRWEGFCNVIVEALLCGLPVVSTDCPSGPAEILQDKYGSLVPVANIEEFATAVLKVLDTPNFFPEEQQKKRAMDFTVEAICEQYLNLMQRVMVDMP